MPTSIPSNFIKKVAIIFFLIFVTGLTQTKATFSQEQDLPQASLKGPHISVCAELQSTSPPPHFTENIKKHAPKSDMFRIRDSYTASFVDSSLYLEQIDRNVLGHVDSEGRDFISQRRVLCERIESATSSSVAMQPVVDSDRKQDDQVEQLILCISPGVFSKERYDALVAARPISKVGPLNSVAPSLWDATFRSIFPEATPLIKEKLRQEMLNSIPGETDQAQVKRILIAYNLALLKKAINVDLVSPTPLEQSSISLLIKWQEGEKRARTQATAEHFLERIRQHCAEGIDHIDRKELDDVKATQKAHMMKLMRDKRMQTGMQG